ncbi:MAG: thioredoxin family protein [Candidatus Methylacidiphilales bacterium]
MPWLFLVVLVLSKGLSWGWEAGAHPARTKGLAEVTAVAPGGTFWVATELEMKPGWHVYWINPGDSGLPPSTDWEVPEGVKIGPVQWPYPHEFKVGPLISLGYEGRVLLMQEVQVPDGWPVGKDLVLKGKVSWLVCEDICLPGSGQIEVKIPVRPEGGERNPSVAEAFAETRAAWPVELEKGAVRTRVQGNELVVEAEVEPGPGEPKFYPLAEGFTRLAERQVFTRTGKGFQLQVPLDRVEVLENGKVRGVLVNERGFPGFSNRRALAFESELQRAGQAGEGTQPGSALPIGLAIGFALLGGVMLNLMPCVFPILSLKVMGFVEHAAEDPAALRRQGLLFGVGVVISFWVLAGVLLLLRAGGEQLGWGFQLQSPGFVAFLAGLFFLIGLSLAGVFEVGTGLMRLGGVTSGSGNRTVEALLSGALATVVATPCTAPLMGPALGAALAMPTWQAVLVFTALGVGMAGPYVLLSFQPKLAGALPRPGPWMESFKQFMAFPMFGTVIWLGWVFALQTGVDGLIDLWVGLLLLGVAAWVWGRWNTPVRSAQTRRIAVGVALALALFGSWWAYQATGHEPAGGGKETETDPWGISWIPFSQETVDRLIAEGRTVYLDFTAAWCVTCQANKRVVFGSEEVRQRFRELNVAAVRADWTRYDPAITEALKSYGRAGVPLNVVYRPSNPGQPIILTEFPLTPGEVLSALGEGRSP